MSKATKTIQLFTKDGEGYAAFASRPTMETADKILAVRKRQAIAYDKHTAEVAEIADDTLSQLRSMETTEKLNRLAVQYIFEFVTAIVDWKDKNPDDVDWQKVDILEAQEFVNSFRSPLGI